MFGDAHPFSRKKDAQVFQCGRRGPYLVQQTYPLWQRNCVRSRGLVAAASDVAALGDSSLVLSTRVP